jgi:hypothetical protein
MYLVSHLPLWSDDMWCFRLYLVEANHCLVVGIDPGTCKSLDVKTKLTHTHTHTHIHIELLCKTMTNFTIESLLVLQEYTVLCMHIVTIELAVDLLND